MKCPKCGGTIFSQDACPRCGALNVQPVPNIPGATAPGQHSSTFKKVDIEDRIKARNAFGRYFKVPLIVAACYFLMDVYLNNMPEADHLVDEPWPFVFQMSRLVAFVSFVITLVLRRKTPMLYFIWSVTAAVVVRIGAVAYRYGADELYLIEWVWALLGFVVIASFWILKFGVHHRLQRS